MSTIFTCANGLSFLRILLTPVFITLLLQGQLLWALVIFTFAAITDTFDGYYARQHNAKTPLGAFLDPLADKILVLSTFGVFCHLNLVSGWILVILCGRDILMTLARVFLVYQNNALVTSQRARLKTFMQFVVLYALFAYVLCLAYLSPQVTSWIYGCIQCLTWCVAGMSVTTAFDYMNANKNTAFLKAQS